MHLYPKIIKLLLNSILSLFPIIMRIILGSKSKWRQSIAQESLGVAVELSVAGIDEKEVARKSNPSSPSQHVEVIASAKLDAVLGSIEGDEDAIVLCYDTVVVFNDEILEKPIDQQDLERMVRLWSPKGSKTIVYTAVAIGKKSTNEKLITVCKSDILMIRDMTEDELKKYKEDKYVRESSGAVIVENLLEIDAAEITEGTLDIIQGFPIEKTKEFVNKLNK